MPEIDGLETLERLRVTQPKLKVVILSGVSDPPKVVQAMRLGALDYLTKPFQKAHLDAILKQCWDPQVSLGEPGMGIAEIVDLGDDMFFVAACPAMRKLRTQIEQVAKVDVPVLLLGESGTGKEIAALLLHQLSLRAKGPFLKVNCAALPADLLESELFGYEAGAFTGASRPKPGKFELCNKGTILLDEIGEMHPLMQAKLLHVIQDQQFSRLGSRSMTKVDVRILAATNVEVQKAIADKKLRPDLYYRLNAITIHQPPLRERREEIPTLLRHFMARFAARFTRPPLPLPPELIEACVRCPWPGNLRELENFVKRYLILGDQQLALSELEAQEEFSAPRLEGVTGEKKTKTNDLKSLVRGLKDKAEMEAIGRVLQQTNWHRKEAARLLGISYKALLYKIRQFGLAPQ